MAHRTSDLVRGGQGFNLYPSYTSSARFQYHVDIELQGARKFLTTVQNSDW